MDAREIARKSSEYAFGNPLVTNIFRAIVVEAIVDEALRPDWMWCSQDWGAFDFQHIESGCRLEVKQSAALQSWQFNLKSPPRRSFDIAERQGYFANTGDWTVARGRHAHIYVFAFHPVTGAEADHRDPSQWEFYVVIERELPKAPAKSISLSQLVRQHKPQRFGDLLAAVECARTSLRPT